MTIAGTKKRGTGGLVSTPPEPAHKTLRKLEREYAHKCAQLESAEKEIKILKAKLAKCHSK